MADHQDDYPPADQREARIASLERDLATLRALVGQYILQRELAEDELHRSEQRYRSLIGKAAYGIFRAAVDGRFLEVNAALAAMLGYASVDALVATDAPRDVWRDPAALERLASRTEGDEAGDWIEVPWRARDGSSRLVRLSLRVVRSAVGAIEWIEGIAEDVTDRARREELLRRSERMASLGTTLAGVAHELNNPLAAISGFAQLLLREPRSDDDRVALETVHREANRAARIVRDLLTFARREESAHRQRVSVNAVVNYIVTARRYAMLTHGIRCVVRLAPDLPPVLADPTQVEQVLLNLIVNAEQALAAALDAPAGERSPSPEAGEAHIAIRTARENGHVLVEVADTGPGIAPEHRSRIWDPFWTTKPEGEGTGLGLAVVHGIVASLGGTIDVESELGAGARFVVRLPEALAPAPPPNDADASNASHHSADPAAARALDVLLVDDEPAILEFLRRYLAERGHAVLTAPAGVDALRYAERMTFDVVICDLRMPGLDGGEVIRRMRTLPHFARTRFVLSTGDVTSEQARRTIEELGVTVVSKPYQVEELRREVES